MFSQNLLQLLPKFNKLAKIQTCFIFFTIIFSLTFKFINNHTIDGIFYQINHNVTDINQSFKLQIKAIKLIKNKIKKQNNSYLLKDSVSRHNAPTSKLLHHLFSYGKMFLKQKHYLHANSIFKFLKNSSYENDYLLNKYLLLTSIHTNDYSNDLKTTVKIFNNLLLGYNISKSNNNKCKGICLWSLNNAFYAGSIISKKIADTNFIKINNVKNDYISLDHIVYDKKIADMAYEIGYFFRKSGFQYYPISLKFLSVAYDYFNYKTKLTGSIVDGLIKTTTLIGITNLELLNYQTAEKFLLKSLHMEEKLLNKNEPFLGFYIKLLVNLYYKQNRITEATALERHIETLMINNARIDNISTLNSSYKQKTFEQKTFEQKTFENFSNDYENNIQNQAYNKYKKPDDLISASKFGIPLAKDAFSEEMKIRAIWQASNSTSSKKKIASFPVNLRSLFKFCSDKTHQKLYLRSGYRSYNTQKTIYNNIGYKGTVAKPGFSEHQSGLAIDINVGNKFMDETDPAYTCFTQHAHKYGIILSFPLGNSYLNTKKSFEPWHWRYIGVYAANLYKVIGPENKPREFLYALPCYSQIKEKNFVDLQFYEASNQTLSDISKLCNFSAKSNTRFITPN